MSHGVAQLPSGRGGTAVPQPVGLAQALPSTPELAPLHSNTENVILHTPNFLLFFIFPNQNYKQQLNKYSFE